MHQASRLWCSWYPKHESVTPLFGWRKVGKQCGKTWRVKKSPINLSTVVIGFCNAWCTLRPLSLAWFVLGDHSMCGCIHESIGSNTGSLWHLLGYCMMQPTSFMHKTKWGPHQTPSSSWQMFQFLILVVHCRFTCFPASTQMTEMNDALTDF